MEKDFRDQVSLVVTEADKVVVRTNEQYEAVGEFLLKIKSLKKEIDASFDPIINKAHAAHKEAIAQKKIHTDPLDKAERVIKPKIGAYIAECERKRREEQLRLEAEAQKQQEELALKEAAAASSAREAEEILTQAIENKPLVVAPKIESKISGLSSRKIWKWKLKNPADIKRDFLTLDEIKINQTVRALGKNSESIVGGIEVFEETIISAGGR